MRRYTFAAVVALLVLVPSRSTVRATPPLYAVENLGLFGTLVPAVVGANGNGQVLGNVTAADGQSIVVRYTDGRGWEALPGLSGVGAVAFAMNDNGDVAGYRMSAGQFRGFRYRDNFPVDDIAPLPNGSMTFAFGINGAGDVVGYGDSNGLFVGFRASVGSDPVMLPSLGGGFDLACGINDAGQVAGYAVTPSGAQHAVRIDPGDQPTVVDIAPLDGAAGTATACAIDSDGHVGGQSSNGAQYHAFKFNAPGVADLDIFASPSSNVEAMAGGLSVGWYTVAGNASRAFAHRDADSSFDLNSRIDAPGWVLLQAKGVSATGVIVGDGSYNGAAAPFRLTPAVSDRTAPVIASVTATPSSIFPPKGQTVPVTVAVSASDDSGAAPVCSLQSISAPGATPNDYAVTGAFTGTVRAVGGRTYTFTVRCTDGAQNSTTGTALVTVLADTTAPVIASVTATPANLWPPDGRLVPVTVAVSATDDVDDAPACSVSSVSGAGSDDVTVTGPLSVTLRAVGGRTYSLAVRCTDAAGNASTGSANVVVPADVTAPVIASVTATPANLWPPDGRLVPVAVAVSATDDVDAQPSCALSGISGGVGDDAVITGPFAATLRAVGGRTYGLSVRCADAAGNASSKTATVVVPPDTTAPAIHSVTASPASIFPPNNALVQVLVTISATDDVDKTVACGLTAIVAPGAAAGDSSITGPNSALVRAVGGRTYTLNVSCFDNARNRSDASTTVVVPPDTTAPVITSLSASPATIWPPNGKLVPVSVTVTATDNVDASPACSLTSVGGGAAGDSAVTGQFTANVRANGGAVYALTVTCSDNAGNKSTAAVNVSVTKDTSGPLKPNASKK